MAETAIIQADHKPSTMDLLSIALQNNAAIDVIERLAALQEKSLAREAEIEFNDAMNKVQEQIKRVAPDLDNPQTRSRYASYAAIDRKIRPIYSQSGFSLSFDTADCPLAEHVRVVCYVARAGHTRRYQVDMPCDGKGAKGGDVMSKTHASGAAMSYGMRYLVKGIFNIAVGEEDTDGNLATNGELQKQIEQINNAQDSEELKQVFQAAYAAFETNPAALKVLVEAKNERKAALKVEQPAVSTPTQATPLVSQKDWARLHASAAERGITHDEIAKFYRRKFHVESGNQLTPVQFNLICREVATWKGPEIA